MPEIKTRQRKNQPVMNTAQRQMQRNFVRSKAEQVAHRQSEQSDSPSNYAEEKISRTAEDAIRDVGTFAREHNHKKQIPDTFFRCCIGLFKKRLNF